MRLVFGRSTFAGAVPKLMVNGFGSVFNSSALAGIGATAPSGNGSALAPGATTSRRTKSIRG